MTEWKDHKAALIRAGNLHQQLISQGAKPHEASVEAKALFDRILPEGDKRGAFSAMAIGWARSGFPCVRPTAKLAASLIATTVSPDDATRLAWPWPSFVVEFPEPIHLTSSCVLQAVLGATVQRGASSSMWLYVATSTKTLVDVHRTLGDAIKDDLFLVSDNPTFGDVERLKWLSLRLFVGVLAELMGHSNEVLAHEQKRRSHNRRATQEPRAWTFVLRRDVAVDVRSAIHEYAAGRRASHVTVQTLVQGHYKAQPHGPGRSLRKWLHIEPYWRGPEDAPIVVRTRELEGKK